MIVPSIDIMDGHAVQLIGGREKALDAGDPRPLAAQFRLAGEIAVVDLDAALGRGSNAALIRELCRLAPCRVGGGIRDVDTARGWLDAGAAQVVLGTAARPEILRELPPARVVAALDAVDGEVVVDGWRERTGRGIVERMQELSGLCGGFLVTFVEREGRLGGTNLDAVKELRTAAGAARLTIAGGVTTTDDVAALDRLGAEAQVGMALYTGRLPLADAWAAPLVSDRPDGLWPTVVTDDRGIALGLAWSDLASLRAAFARRQGVYHSRSRGLWIKGATSGDTQDLVTISLDCDRDALRFEVRQRGRGFCHSGTATCFGEVRGLEAVEKILRERLARPHPGSYTQRLLSDPALLRAKLVEEAGELSDAPDAAHAAEEAADVLYFSLVRLLQAGGSLEDVEHVLDLRARKVTRRPGDAKPRGGD